MQKDAQLFRRAASDGVPVRYSKKSNIPSFGRWLRIGGIIAVAIASLWFFTFVNLFKTSLSRPAKQIDSLRRDSTATPRISASQDRSTAEWKTYECPRVYTLEYPPYWYLWPQGHGACSTLSLSSESLVPSISVDCYQGVDGQIPSPETWNDSIAGYKAYVRLWNGAPDSIREPHYRETVYLLKPGTLLTCAFDLFDTPSRTYGQLLRQIISTVSFDASGL